MSENGNEDNERFEVEGFGLRFRGPTKKAAEVIAVMSLFLSFAIGGAFWLHRAEANESAKEIKATIKEGNASQIRVLKAMLKQQVLQSCLQQFDTKDRLAKLPLCKELSKQAVVDTE